MATFNFSLALYGFDQFSGSASTNNTVRYQNGTQFTLDANATLSVIDIQDDDGNPVGSPNNMFSDGFIDTPGDGSPSNTANNDQVLTQAVTINGTTFQPGDQVELEFAFTTTAGETFWVIRIDGQNVGISGPQLPTPGTSYEVASSSDGQEVPESEVPCFTDGTMIQTPDGCVPIEALKPGDMVLTADHGAQPIRWVGIREPSPLELAFFENVRPVVISKDALGPNMPNADLVVSPLHRIVVRSGATDLYFGEAEVLIAAKDLVNGTSIYVDGSIKPIYRHLMLEKHEILVANNLASESLYPATSRLLPDDVLEIESLAFSESRDHCFARPTLKGYESKVLAH